MTEAAELKARNAIAKALKCAPGAVDADASVETLPEWDSIGHVNIILEVEGDLGRPLLSEEIAGISSFADVVLIYQRHQASA